MRVQKVWTLRFYWVSKIMHKWKTNVVFGGKLFHNYLYEQWEVTSKNQKQSWRNLHIKHPPSTKDGLRLNRIRMYAFMHRQVADTLSRAYTKPSKQQVNLMSLKFTCWVLDSWLTLCFRNWHTPMVIHNCSSYIELSYCKLLDADQRRDTSGN